MPTENRPSNTEMVSVPPYIGLEPLVGRYYPAQCRRCGWVGSSEELTEDDAQCTRDVGDRLCLGDCDELERHDLLNIIQAMATPQPHPEPAGWQFYQDGKWWNGDDRIKDHRKNTEDAGYPVRDVFAQADPGEVERLRAALKFYADRDHFAEDIGSDWDSVSGEPANVLWHEQEAWFVEDGSIARAALERQP